MWGSVLLQNIECAISYGYIYYGNAIIMLPYTSISEVTGFSFTTSSSGLLYASAGGSGDDRKSSISIRIMSPMKVTNLNAAIYFHCFGAWK